MSAPSWLLGVGDGDGPPFRTQRVDPPAHEIHAENQRKLTVLLAKSVLKNCSDIRELQSAILTTLLIPKDTTVVGAMSAAKPPSSGRMEKIVNVIALVNHMFMHGLR